MKLTIIHIDDDPSCLKITKEMLEELDYADYIAGFTTFDLAFESIEQFKPNVLLLDIVLGQGSKNIFQYLESIKHNTQLIFISGYPNYAIEAYKIKATHFIEKPVLKKELIEALEMAKKNLILEEVHSLSELISQLPRKNSEQVTKIKISTSEKIHFVALDELEYISADGNYTKFYKTDMSVITSSRILKYYRGLLLGHPQFVSISRSVVLNKNFLTEIKKNNGKYKACMVSGAELEISKIRNKDVLTELKIKLN